MSTQMLPIPNPDARHDAAPQNDANGDGIPDALNAAIAGQYAPSVLDEDDFATNSPTRPPSQQSAKAYIAAVAAPAAVDQFIDPFPTWFGGGAVNDAIEDLVLREVDEANRVNAVTGATHVAIWDTFKRATLGSTFESGQTITTFGTPSTNGTDLRAASTSGVVGASGANNYLVAATVKNFSNFSTSEVGLILRYIDASNFLAVQFRGQSTGRFRIVKCVAGVYTSLVSTEPMSPVDQDNARYRLSARIVGAVIHAELDGGGGLRYPLTHTLTGGDETTFATSDIAGVWLSTHGAVSDLSVRAL